MAYKIFLSHNHNDKPLVEAVALKLAGIFGQNQVFYDSWSIQPGEGIIDQMNKGLEAPEYVFFFVSRNSLASGMVRLEWQNALYAASSGKIRMIPVRVDGSEMPAVLKQTLYIDMHTVGLDDAIAQIVRVTQGNGSFTPQHQGFSNLSYVLTKTDSSVIDITVSASHLMEPNPSFLFVTNNSAKEIDFKLMNNQPLAVDFIRDFAIHDTHGKANGILIRPIGSSLTPSHPLRFQFIKRGVEDINIFAVFHQKGENDWVQVPFLL